MAAWEDSARPRTLTILENSQTPQWCQWMWNSRGRWTHQPEQDLGPHGPEPQPGWEPRPPRFRDSEQRGPCHPRHRNPAPLDPHPRIPQRQCPRRLAAQTSQHHPTPGLQQMIASQRKSYHHAEVADGQPEGTKELAATPTRQRQRETQSPNLPRQQPSRPARSQRSLAIRQGRQGRQGRSTGRGSPGRTTSGRGWLINDSCREPQPFIGQLQGSGEPRNPPLPLASVDLQPQRMRRHGLNPRAAQPRRMRKGPTSRRVSSNHSFSLGSSHKLSPIEPLPKVNSMVNSMGRQAG